MKIAPREISALLHQPESRFHAYLLYGHDEGLVRERARKLASHFADNLDDPFAVSHLTGPDVAADKASLSDSLNALPAFGGLRLVMLSGAGTEMTEAVKLAFEHLHEGARLVIQASDVNTRHALVKFCDQQPSCASIGCYQDDSRSLGELAREIFAKDSIKIETNALALLLSRLGNDRAVSRMEIEKLVLFAGPGGTLNAQDIDHALGDSGAIVQDQITIAILSGNVKQFEQLYSRAKQDGLPPIALLRQTLSLFRGMLSARLALNAGKPAGAALSGFRPPLHFKTKPVVTAQLSKWGAQQLSDVIDRLIDTEIQIKSAGVIDPATLTGQTLLGLVLRSRSLNR